VSLLNEVVTQAKRIGGESVLLTFWPHPKFMLFPEDNELKLLQSLEEKLEAFADLLSKSATYAAFTVLFILSVYELL
jgi:riboflavin kinase/FMN adenylyltransferase